MRFLRSWVSLWCDAALLALGYVILLKKFLFFTWLTAARRSDVGAVSAVTRSPGPTAAA